MDITIRPARPEDIPPMCDLLADLFSIESDFSPDRKKQALGLSLLLNDPSGSSHALVAVGGGAVIGMATVQTFISTAEGGPVGIIEDVVVDSRCRGRGIGTLLLEHSIEWSRSRNLTRLQLLADRENMPAINFYIRNGWTATRLDCLRKLLPYRADIS